MSGEVHEAPRVHHATRRRGSDMAACGTGAAVSEVAHHRVHGREHAFDRGQWADAFVKRLQELGWIEARTVAIEYRWAEGRSERVEEIAAEFVRLKVDVIVTSGTPVIGAKQATSLIPIVFAVAGDPVGTGLVEFGATGWERHRPVAPSTDLAGKRLELLREVVPNLRRLAILGRWALPARAGDGEVQAAARTLGLVVATVEIWRAEDIAPVFDEIKARVDALYVVPTRSLL